MAERAALIRRVAELHTERRDKLAEIIKREMGKSIEEGLGEVDFSAAIFEYFADNAETFLADEPVELLAGEGSAVIKRTALGRCSASCRGTSRTTRWLASPGRT